jgi:hypothetical protein
MIQTLNLVGQSKVTDLQKICWAELSGTFGLQILVILVCDGHRFLCTLGNINHLSLLNY